MDTNAYRSMKELIDNLQSKLARLEGGQLAASELENLVQESRELYERLVVLRYKALEKQIIGSVKEAPVVLEKKQEVAEEKVEVPTFKINMSNPVKTPTSQTSILDAEVPEMKETKEEIKPVVEPKLETKQAPVAVEEKLSSSTDIGSLNEKLSQQQQKVSLAEKLQKKPISDLKTAIGLNQKFLFMNDLFEGENTAYNEAVNQLNSMSSMDDAKNLLLSLGTKYNWDLESESVVQFTELVERRYS